MHEKLLLIIAKEKREFEFFCTTCYTRIFQLEQKKERNTLCSGSVKVKKCDDDDDVDKVLRDDLNAFLIFFPFFSKCVCEYAKKVLLNPFELFHTIIMMKKRLTARVEVLDKTVSVMFNILSLTIRCWL